MSTDSTCLFDTLDDINKRPEPFSTYTAKTLWDDDHISKKMLEFHLDETSAPASRPRDFLDQSAAWIADRFSLGQGKRIVDLGCGPGLYTTRFAKTGATVTGVDFSRRSIAYAQEFAREKKLPINYVLSDYLEYRSDEKSDVATLIYCDFCVLAPEKRGQLLRVIRELLTEGGSLLLDVSSLHAFDGREETTLFAHNFMGGFWAADDYWCFQNTFKYGDAKVVVDKYTIVQPERTWQVFNWLQYYSLETLTNELKESGFRVVEHYDDVAGANLTDISDTIAVVAQ